MNSYLAALLHFTIGLTCGLVVGLAVGFRKGEDAQISRDADARMSR